jgi:glycosyltransferase involved in cell wall biosynthesis
MKKRSILFYTDCFIFGGCEKPIFEVIKSSDFNAEYDFKVVFRHTDEYLMGLRQFWPAFPGNRFIGLKLFDINNLYYWLTKKRLNKLFLRITIKLFSLIFIFINPIIFIYDFLALSLVFIKNKADVIHINNGGYPGALSCRAAAAAAKFIGFKKIIFSVHNTAFKDTGFMDRLMDSLVKRSIDIIVTGSKASGLALARNRGFNQNKIINIYHGVHESVPLPKSQFPAEGFNSERSITMVARFEDRKGHKYVIEAFKKLLDMNSSFADIKLNLIGDGPTLADIKYLVELNGLGNNVRFLGHRDDYVNYIASSLILLNPSIGYEDLPYIILEAMSLGVPVIGTDIAGIPEEIEDTVTGIVVPPKDSAALAQAIFSLLSDDKKRVQVGSAARDRFRRIFTIDGMLKNYLLLYEGNGEYACSYNQ